MSENEKLAAFGSWLTALKIQKGNELYMMSVSARHSEASIRVKAGQLEATQFILDAFTELYSEPLQKFMEERMGAKKEGEEEELEGDVSHTQ